jgi:hypothetical protein
MSDEIRITRPLYSELISTWQVYDSVTGLLADPTIVTCTFESPGTGTTIYTYGTNAEVTKNATGVYVFRMALTYVGQSHWKWRGTGAVIASSYRNLVVVPKTEDD